MKICTLLFVALYKYKNELESNSENVDKSGTDNPQRDAYTYGMKG